MAYNNQNRLKRIVEVQEIYKRYQRQGCTGVWIYENVIGPKFHISKSTLTKFLAVNAKRELREVNPDELERLINEININH